MTTIGYTVVFALCATVALARQSLFDETARFYGYASWRGMTKQTYCQVLSSYMAPSVSLPTNSWPIGIDVHQRDASHYIIDTYSLTNGTSMLSIETAVLTNVMAAQDYMINRFAGCAVRHRNMSTNDIGDRGYSAKYAKGSFSIFTRNNVFVSVGSSMDTILAEHVARQIDADILRKSTGSGKLTWLVCGLIGIGLLLAVTMICCRKTNPMSEDAVRSGS